MECPSTSDPLTTEAPGSSADTNHLTDASQLSSVPSRVPSDLAMSSDLPDVPAVALENHIPLETSLDPIFDQQTSPPTAVEEPSSALDSSAPPHSNIVIPEVRGQDELANETTSVNSASRTSTPEIPDDIVKQSRAGDASRSLMLHKSREAKEVYNIAFNSGIAKVQAICMDIAEKSGQKYKKVEADLFAAMSTKHKRKPKAWDTFITKKMDELNDGKRIVF
jgi:hypothetical protein